MQHPDPQQPPKDELNAVYEACSAALRKLEAMSGLSAEWSGSSYRRIVRATGLLREVAMELRALDGERAHLLSAGFVLPTLRQAGRRPAG